MLQNPFQNQLKPAPKQGGFKKEDSYIWCGSVVLGEDGRYHMFASCWPHAYGFGTNWLTRCEIVRAASDTPEGPYHYEETVLSARGSQFFDGMNTHNPMICRHNGKYYLYYMGTTYNEVIRREQIPITPPVDAEIWNRKRIGVAVADSVYGPWQRFDEPVLAPRGCEYWDCTGVTNPAVCILEDGRTYMLYKSRSYAFGKLMIGAAMADSPLGPFRRISDEPVFQFDGLDSFVEDPFLWYADGYFHAILKDDCKNGCKGVTGSWGSGFYARSRDCIRWEIPENPTVYTREVLWDDGTVTTQPNLERPFLLFDEKGTPTHLFFATGDGEVPYQFEHSWNMVIPLKTE